MGRRERYSPLPPHKWGYVRLSRQKKNLKPQIRLQKELRVERSECGRQQLLGSARAFSTATSVRSHSAELETAHRDCYLTLGVMVDRSHAIKKSGSPGPADPSDRILCREQSMRYASRARVSAVKQIRDTTYALRSRPTLPPRDSEIIPVRVPCCAVPVRLRGRRIGALRSTPQVPWQWSSTRHEASTRDRPVSSDVCAFLKATPFGSFAYSEHYGQSVSHKSTRRSILRQRTFVSPFCASVL